MPSNYFGGAPNAWQGGVEFSAAQRQRRVQENALNAMIERFGPEAANPAALGQMQMIEQQAALAPHVLAGAERTTNAQEALVSAYGPHAGDPAAVATDERLQAQDTRAARMATTYLQQVRDRGGDLSAAFDQIQRTLPAVGVPSEHIPMLRDHILSNPDSLDELMAMFNESDRGANPARGLSGGVAMRNNRTGELEWVIPTEGGHRTVPGYTPVSAEQADTRLRQGDARIGIAGRALTLDEQKAAGFDAAPNTQLWWEGEPGNSRIVADAIPGSEQDAGRTTARQQQMDALDKDMVGLGVVTEQAESVTRWGERALGNMDDSWLQQHNPLAAIARRAAAASGGTATSEIKADLDNIRGVIAIDELLRIKSRGATLGQVTTAELELLKNMLSTLTIDRDPAALREDLQEVLRRYNTIIAKSHGEIERIRGLQSAPAADRYGPPVPPPGGGTGQMSDEDLLQLYSGRGGR